MKYGNRGHNIPVCLKTSNTRDYGFITSQNHGYIIFMDNWSPGWEVSVNGIKKKIELVLGSYKAVKIKNGINKIIFKYKPW